MVGEIIDIDLEGDSDGNGNECSKKVGKVGFLDLCFLTCYLKRDIWCPPCVFFMAPSDDVNKSQEIDDVGVGFNASKGVETKGLTNGKKVDSEVHLEESQKESIVEDYYEPRQDIIAQGVWLEKEDKACAKKEHVAVSTSHNVADDHNDDLKEE
ncbi:hypothetical protein SLEP1_g33887 [Rubroshorea leprosula]|uniref:Uncharacterized protein n=1 Tax=Rubroshorea leprosula TaxID=152421 RepID=A0AAV5KI13_9ROSI|nr:hypothetical protein SLEP1_g33887 [Rubroshorea leprosula]